MILIVDLMNKKERIKLILATLHEYFPDPEIPLFHKDPYTLLIAVILSAQSTDSQVNKVTTELFKRVSSPAEMIKISFEELRQIINPVGLGPTKAKAILSLSQDLLQKHKGKVPQSFLSLESLPGVGHKTAGVVLAQAFDKKTFPVDTHIKRCAIRWRLSNGKTPLVIEKDLKKLIPKKLWKKVHLQIIYFARNYCKARGHDKDKCPMCKKLSRLYSSQDLI